MGSWGTGILSDDLAKDVYSDFMELYDDGLELSIIRNKVEEIYTDLDDEELPVFYLALAKAQWECKALDRDVFNKVKEIVDFGTGLELWEEAGISTYNKRVRVLKEFVVKLSTEKEKPRRRNKTKKAEAIFEPGDCLVFNLEDGTFGGALVVDKHNDHKTEGLNVIALLDIKCSHKPVINDFLNANVLLSKNSVYGKNETIMLNCLGRTYKKHRDYFTKIGNVSIKKIFKSNIFSRWDQIITITNQYYFKTKDNIEYDKGITVKKLLGENIIKKIKGFFG